MNKMILLLSLIFFSSCNSEKKPREMTSMEVYGQLKNDFCLLIDIRENGSYSKTAEQALTIPYSEIEKNANDIKSLLKKDSIGKTIVLFSDKADLSIQACTLFIKSNYECHYMTDFSKWEEEKLPTRNL